jgi:hypothetical protein
VAIPRVATSQDRECPQLAHVANIPIAAAATTAVASHPSTVSNLVSTNSPTTDLREAMSIMITMIGTAATPLIIALQISAFIGSRGVKFRVPAALRSNLSLNWKRAADVPTLWSVPI